MGPPMHACEREIDEPLVRRLLAAQFPRWAELPLRRLAPSGTDHAVFRLGDALSVRLPRIDGPRSAGGVEAEWLAKLAPRLPVEVPVPVAQGRPGEGYPWFWEIHTWVPGETVPVQMIDPDGAVSVLAGLLDALARVDPAGGPPGRGVALAQRDASFRWWRERFTGDPRVDLLWARALAAPPWEGSPVWHHGDLDARNWLVRDGRITGVIDWGLMGVGDPACDLMVAWKLHSVSACEALRAAVPADVATWERARGWVVSQAVAILAYYTPQTNPVLVAEAESWLAVVLASDDG